MQSGVYSPQHNKGGYIFTTTLIVILCSSVIISSIMTAINKKNKNTYWMCQFSIQTGILELYRPRNDRNLRLVDGMRVICLFWIVMLGTCQFTMLSSVSNPWSLQDYFHTYAYTLVYSSNLGFDEFFFLSAFLATLKLQNFKPS